MVPSSAHAPPRLLLASQIGDKPPPVARIFFSLPSAKNAIHCPSGEKNGLRAPSVPASGVARNWSRRRRRAAICPPPFPRQMRESRRPARESRRCPGRVGQSLVTRRCPDRRSHAPARSAGAVLRGQTAASACPAATPSAPHKIQDNTRRSRRGAARAGCRSTASRSPDRSRAARRRCRAAAALRSFSRQRPISVRILCGVVAGSAVQSGSRSRTAAIVSDDVSPSNARRPVSISYSTQPNAQMSVRLSTGLPACLLAGSCRRPSRA